MKLRIRSGSEILYKEYQTFSDKDGRLRFKYNSLVRQLFLNGHIQTSKIIDDYRQGLISTLLLVDYFTGIGYAVNSLFEIEILKKKVEEVD